ncbi:MAG: DUF6127 family protein [Pseudomonadales bacterium]
MTTPLITLSNTEIEDLLESAAEKGAIRALANVGLDSEESTAHDIRELRSLLQAYTLAKRTAWQTIIRLITTGFILALIAGAAIKLKIFDGP